MWAKSSCGAKNGPGAGDLGTGDGQIGQQRIDGTRAVSPRQANSRPSIYLPGIAGGAAAGEGRATGYGAAWPGLVTAIIILVLYRTSDGWR